MAVGGVKGVVALGVAAVVVAGSAVLALDGLTGAPGTRTAAASPSASDAARVDPADAAADAAAVAGRYLAAWAAGDWDTMAAVTADPPDLARVYGGMAERLGVTTVVATPAAARPDGSVPFTVTLTLRGLGEVSWASQLATVVGPTGRLVEFRAVSVHPALLPGQRLDLVAAPGAQVAVVDRRGRPLSDDPDLSRNLLSRLRELGPDGPARTTVAVVDAVSGDVVSVVKAFPGGGPALATTLDLDVQAAAARALRGVRGTASVVVLDAPTGEVRAVANTDTGEAATALTGRYAPGSTFKIVTALAALRSGVSPSTRLECPDSISVNGKRFRNHEDGLSSRPSLTTAFAQSCNTAFIALAQDLPEGALRDAAHDLGFDVGRAPLEVDSFGGTVPDAGGDVVEEAADAIGQGRVQASPLQMATVAAAVASGRYHRPHLVACDDCSGASVAGASGLRTMMREVVTSGTARVARSVPGGPVHGKTGTAEFGETGDTQTHAWFVGWQGDLAFAVFVDRGESGGHTAAPVAAAMLERLSQ